VTVNPRETLTDSQKLDQLIRMAEHLDDMVHEVHQFVTEARPHLEKAVRFLDPGLAMRRYMENRPAMFHKKQAGE
jgi:ABC-type transporter Mla subunit MlaD